MSELKKIDLTPLVGSQVLMQFEDNKSLVSKPFKTVGFLCGIHKIADFFLYAETDSDHAFDSCRIYQHPDYWISNVDGKLVLPIGLVTRSMYGDGGIIKSKTNTRFKHNIGGVSDLKIIAVQVIGPAEGCSY